jgi:hypothetical protein
MYIMTENPLKELFLGVYNKYVREHFPEKIGMQNGVAVRGPVRLLDRQDVFPEYEAALIAGLRERINSSDDVVIVGGGRGVSTVAAAHLSGSDGSVLTYEAISENVSKVEETVDLNQVAERVEVTHSIVGEYSEFSEDYYGTPGSATVVQPSDLPDCDVLELDCEGAELNILRQMRINPTDIIVETHEFLGISTQDISKALESMNYKILNKRVESESKGVYVLTATKA